MDFKNSFFHRNDSDKRFKSNIQNEFSHANKHETKPTLAFTPNLILKNTEYFTHLQNYLTFKIPYIEVQVDYFFQAIETASLCKVIVQNMYLLQICYLSRTKVYLSTHYYTQKSKYLPNLHNISVFQLYCFENQINEKVLEQKCKILALQHKFIKIFDQEESRIDDFLLIIERLVKTTQTYLKHLQKSLQNRSFTNSQAQQNKKFLIEFVNVFYNLIEPQKQRFSTPKLLLKLLEQTKLFRSHSLLVKIVNGSLFYSIKLFSAQILQELKNSIHQIKKYFQHAVFEKKFQKQVVKTIDDFFTTLCRSNVIEITKSLKGLHEEGDLMQKDILSLFDYDDPSISQNPTVTALILVPQQKYYPISFQLLQRILSNTSLQGLLQDKEFVPPKNLQIEISYTYVTNDIRIKCITEIDMGVDNIDYLTYLMSAFNEGMKSTLVVDIIEKFRKSMTKKIQKVIAFRLSYRAKQNEEPLTKILQLIDIAVLASKIFVTELSKRSYIKLEEYQKRQKICEIFRHYENIFRSLMKKFYTEIKEEK